MPIAPVENEAGSESTYGQAEQSPRPTSESCPDTRAIKTKAGPRPIPGILKDLQARGLVQDVSDPALASRLDKEPMVLYCGFDPTSDSLQLGNLVPLISLARFQRAGHTPIVVLGGGTGMIGDPSGRSDERKLLDEETIRKNTAGQMAQFASVLDFESQDNPAVIVNNIEWLGELSLVDFLRDVGKSFSVSVMMSRESVKQRLSTKAGISFTEFSYQILQAYDFYHLYKNHGCLLQSGGSDQYGNIIAGLDYIRRIAGHDHGAAALTFPLVKTSKGEKFGKTAAGALWLDSKRTSPYEWYQYWFNVTDDDVIRYLKFFTFLDLDEIDTIQEKFSANPKERLAQRILANEVTSLVHGSEAAEQASRGSTVLFHDDPAQSGIAQEAVSTGAPTFNAPDEALAHGGYDLIEALVMTSLADSRTVAKTLLRQGAVDINGNKAGSEKRSIQPTDLQSDRSCLIAVGRRQRAVIIFCVS